MRLWPGARRSGFEPQLYRLHLDAWEASVWLLVKQRQSNLVSALFLPIRQVPSTDLSV